MDQSITDAMHQNVKGKITRLHGFLRIIGS